MVSDAQIACSFLLFIGLGKGKAGLFILLYYNINFELSLSSPI